MKRLIIPAALIMLLAVVVALTILIQRGSADTVESSAPVSTQTTHYVKVPNIIRETEASTAPAETRQTQIGQDVHIDSSQSGVTLPIETGILKDDPPTDSSGSSG